MDDVILGRVLTASTLGFHIIFATIGVGMPIVIMVLEFLGIRKKDTDYLTMARRIAKGYTVTVAVGVVTGTIIGLQLSLIWPEFMRLGGQIIALPLFMETFAFFFEAIFLGIYLYTWDRFKNLWYHWMLNIPIILGATLSAVFITTVNSFMNTPAGFDMADGELINAEPLTAMFNPSSWVRMFHVVATAYMTAVFIIASIGAFKLLRSKFKEDRTYHKKGLKAMMVAGVITALLTVLAGDFSAKFLHNHQPEKLAAMEWHFDTEENADLVLFGMLDEESQEINYELRIPGFLSFLAGSSFDTEVTGLNDIPEENHPPMIIHYFFDIMVFFGMYALGVSIIYFIAKFTKGLNEHHPALLYAYVLAGPLSVAAIEAGWFLAEMGRQPWILRGYMRVSEAITNADGLGMALIAFVALYAVLGVTCVYVLLKMFKDKSAQAERLELYGESNKGGHL
ncbi:cytochrome ubiquinol oxidase subunit I [Salinicoccus albus]|uniref:cytochrome ubiquinol oxidase subunit I n=1 Tax=Salinicoccus albus TaxID=418756 RepID=UPI00036CB82A|nr:cytochrome ubiquinol oxidase subunit I [Salinicoccus albus]